MYNMVRRIIILRKRFKVDDPQWYTVSENEPYITSKGIGDWIQRISHLHSLMIVGHGTETIVAIGHSF